MLSVFLILVLQRQIYNSAPPCFITVSLALTSYFVFVSVGDSPPSPN